MALSLSLCLKHRPMVVFMWGLSVRPPPLLPVVISVITLTCAFLISLTPVTWCPALSPLWVISVCGWYWWSSVHAVCYVSGFCLVFHAALYFALCSMLHVLLRVIALVINFVSLLGVGSCLAQFSMWLCCILVLTAKINFPCTWSMSVCCCIWVLPVSC